MLSTHTKSHTHLLYVAIIYSPRTQSVNIIKKKYYSRVRGLQTFYNMNNRKPMTAARDPDTNPEKDLHTCPYCQKQFKRSRDCKVHVRTHTGEKPYKVRVRAAVAVAHEQLTCLSLVKSAQSLTSILPACPAAFCNPPVRLLRRVLQPAGLKDPPRAHTHR